MVDINVGAISEALNNKADRDFNNTSLQSKLDTKANKDLSNIPSNYDYIVESQKPTSGNGYIWYRKYKSGWVEQGVAQRITGGGSIGVVLPVPMADENYTILISQNNSDGGGVYFQCQYHTPTATGFTVISQYGSSRTSRPFLWYVCGIAA